METFGAALVDILENAIGGIIANAATDYKILFIAVVIFAALMCFLYYLKHDDGISGEWEGERYEDNTRKKVISRDRYILKYNGKKQEVRGTIQRLVPTTHNHKRWVFQGILRKDDRMVIIYYSKDTSDPTGGCVFVHQPSGTEYAGYSLERHNKMIEKIPIRLRKLPAEHKTGGLF